MAKLHFYIVDVFAEKKYSGNQLAVFLADETVSGELMQSIARETNFAETTFILSGKPENGGWPVRIFTPGEEIPFAGHPTLGTAFVIQNEILDQTQSEIILNLKVGQIPVTFAEDGILWMRQNQPEFGPEFEVNQVAKLLSLSEDELDIRYPMQGVSTGLPFMLAPLKSGDSLKKARLSLDAYEQMIENPWARSILLFCPEGYETGQQIGARMFAPDFGISEDPATGSANGCLAAYLARYRYFDSNQVDIRVGQGYEIRRPSTLYLKSQLDGDVFDIRVGGKVSKIAEGDFV